MNNQHSPATAFSTRSPISSHPLHSGHEFDDALDQEPTSGSQAGQVLVVRVFASRDGRRGVKGLGDKSREECRGVKGEVDPDGRVE